MQRLIRRVKNQHARRIDVGNLCVGLCGGLFVGEDALYFVGGQVVVGGDASLS